MLTDNLIRVTIFQFTHPTKGDTAILHKNALLHFYNITKTHLFSSSAASETLKILRIHRENNIYLGANPPYFLCELLVRTMMIFAIHSYLLLSYCITPF